MTPHKLFPAATEMCYTASFISIENRKQGDMEELGKLLPAFFKRHWGREDARIIEILGPLWPRVAGRGIAENSIPAEFAGGTLTLETTCASWAVQLRQMSEEIRSGINRTMGRPVVKKIQVRLAPNLGQRDPDLAHTFLGLGTEEAELGRRNTMPRGRTFGH